MSSPEVPIGWSLEQDGTRLVREFIFAAHTAAAEFVFEIARLSEQQDHHPEVLLTWRACRVSSWSHDSGGVTRRDVTLALAINEMRLRWAPILQRT